MWQPIETAPRDGTWIDVWSIDLGRITNVRLHPKLEHNEFTHWMPIPKGPDDEL